MWMKMPRLVQQLASGHLGKPLTGQNQGNVLAVGRKFCQPGTRFDRRLQAADAVVPRVAITQLLLDVAQGVRILLHHE
jgi:hypothetical protein